MGLLGNSGANAAASDILIKIRAVKAEHQVEPEVLGALTEVEDRDGSIREMAEGCWY